MRTMSMSNKWVRWGALVGGAVLSGALLWGHCRSGRRNDFSAPTASDFADPRPVRRQKKISRPDSGPAPAKVVIDRQWVLNLLQGIKQRKLMDSRYDNFLKTARELIENDQVKLSFRETSNLAEVSYLYHQPTDTLEIVYSDKTLPRRELRSMLEATVIHELFHAVQDKDKRAGSGARMEAEAYLAEASYYAKAYPEYAADDWLVLRPAFDPSQTCSVSFHVPHKLAREANEGSTADYNRIVQIAVENYVISLQFREAFFSDIIAQRIPSLYQEVAPSMTSLGSVAITTRQFESGFLNAPGEHLVVQYIAGEEYVAYSLVLIDYLAFSKISVDSAWAGQSRQEAQRQFNKAYSLFAQKAMPAGSKAFIHFNTTRPANFDGITVAQ